MLLTLGAIRSIHVTLIGAVRQPGTLTVSSLATLFNALYATGGPLVNGSFRNIELIRGNKSILYADLYDFLLRGDQSANVFLQDNDLIRVPFAKIQVGLNGELNRPGIYESKENETLAQVLDYAGGFKSTAFKGRIIGTRNADLIKEVLDIPADQYSRFTLQHGDNFQIGQLIDKYANRVTIEGAVFKPGVYAWLKGMSLTELVKKAEGLKEDAFLGRINILRTRENLSKENITLDLAPVLKGTIPFELQKEDIVSIFSTLDLKGKFSVSILGPVRSPGIYAYDDSLSLQALILQAGGFLDNASPIGIEVGRRKKELGINVKGAPTAEILTVGMGHDLTKVGTDFLLEPYDIVIIKTDPAKVPQTSVTISGQVLYPGAYVLESKADYLSSMIVRSGGLLPYADIGAAKLLRVNSGPDLGMINRIVDKTLVGEKDSGVDIKNTVEDFSKAKIEVVIDLQKILRAPNTENDIILEEGDEIIVPLLKNVVSIGGEVMNPITLQYNKTYQFKQYISAAGGFTNKANKKKSFVIYSNGLSKQTKHFLGFIGIYPSVEPGSFMVIPHMVDRDRKPMDVAKAAVLISALSTVVTVFVLLF